jgi:hypothetical protein
MPQTIEISESEIAWAESILLPQSKSFSTEARRFIKSVDSIDLQAVPGSGKTTALLAKLLIIGKKLPFHNNAGVLVLSHTNAAVDEIKKHLFHQCPQLFNYPNYIGTIQGFVDEFLAIPCAQNLYRVRLSRIDQQMYEDKIWRTYRNDKAYFEINKFFYGRHSNRAIAEAKTSNVSVNAIRDKLIQQEFQSLYFDHFDQAIKSYPKNTVLLKDDKNERYKAVKKILATVFLNGIIPYHYAYHLAEFYLNKIPAVKKLLQLRFPYVFVDEMQDMDLQQCRVLETLFQEAGSSVKFQRIGDKNQSIYSAATSQSYWSDQDNVLLLSGSQRLTAFNASVISPFAVNNVHHFNLMGLRSGKLRPHLLVYDDTTIQEVIPFFANKVINYAGNGQLQDFGIYPIKAIAWNTEWNKEQEKNDTTKKIRLIDYYPNFKKQDAVSRIEYSCLKEYLQFADTRHHAMKPIKSNLLNALVKVLRIENCLDAHNKNYTKQTLIRYIEEQDIIQATDNASRLKALIYDWSIKLVRGQLEIVWKELQIYIPEFLVIFKGKYIAAKEFVIKEFDGIPAHEQVDQTLVRNCYTYGSLTIDIGTVHSAKGQTHCATLYLESYYNRYYEVETLASAFCASTVEEMIELIQKEIEDLKTQINNLNGKRGVKTRLKKIETCKEKINRITEAAKMIYVGFSRPTNLLCVAIHKKRFDNHLIKINDKIWEIVVVPKIQQSLL